jgi:hypothetical protein
MVIAHLFSNTNLALFALAMERGFMPRMAFHDLYGAIFICLITGADRHQNAACCA